MRRATVVTTLTLGILLMGAARERASAQDGLEGAPPTSATAAASTGALSSSSSFAPGTEANVAVAKKFYDAYTTGDMTTLDSLYAPDAHWSDPITSFGDREGTMGMWRALAASKAKYTYSLVSAQGDQVVVNWQADYQLFGHPIHNDVLATLTIKDGKVVDHHDSYSWDKWASQAFPALSSVVGQQPIAWILQHSLGAALHAQSLATNAKRAVAPVVERVETGISQEVNSALGR